MSSKHPDHLRIVPLDSAEERRRASEERLAEQPRAVQDWFDATADAASQDARLRAFVDGLLQEPAEEVEDPDSQGDRATVSERRLAHQPRPVQEWFDAMAEAPRADARLRSFVDQLAPPEDRAGDAAAPVVLRPASRRWSTWVVAAGAALAAGGLVALLLQDRGPAADPAPAPAVAEVQAPAPLPTAAPVAEPEAGSVLPPDALEAPAPDALAEAPVQPQATPALPPPTPAAVQPPPTRDQAPAAVALGDGSTEPGRQLASAAPARPEPLRTSGELDATASPWRGKVVDGVDLRLDAGFGKLGGTQSSPLLALSNDATVRVDVDRSTTEAEFATFTIQTVSATVRVVGTRYTVDTRGGRTVVETRRGVVQVECLDGRRKLVSEGQSATCEALPDSRLLAHMQALDRPPMTGQPELSPIEQYAHLQRQRNTTSPAAFVSTADVMLGRALADEDLRRVIEAVRIDAMCDLGWEGPARASASAWIEAGGQVERDHIGSIASQGCPAR